MTTKTKKRAPRQRLHCYAPGDGSLHFCWILDGKASGRRTTMADVRRFMKTKEGQRLERNGWRPMKLNSSPVLVAYVERVDQHGFTGTVRTYAPCSGDEEPQLHTYTYHILPSDQSWLERKMLNIGSILVTTLHKNETVEVKNWSTKAKIAHFLNYEREITAWDEAMRFKHTFGAKS